MCASERDELSHLEGEVYLDYAGAGVYCQSQVRALAQDLTQGGLGNPHSKNRGGERSRERIELLREELRTHFNAENYHVVLTSGATGALRMVAHNFNFTSDSSYTVLEHNHNSVLGIRNCCLAKGGRYAAVPLSSFPPKVNASSLVAAPLVCNYSGLVVPLKWCRAVREGGGASLVDAAGAFGKKTVDLSDIDTQPDFLVGSFYKAFGLPTGMGFLLIRKNSERLFHPTYFGGGTLLGASATEAWEERAQDVPQSLEDGTISFLDIGAALYGLNLLKKMSLCTIETRLKRLTETLVEGLRALQHGNGVPLCKIHGHDGVDEYIGIVAFTMQERDGTPIGYNAAVEVANAHKIHIRGGCFCNPGACHKYLNLTTEDAKSHRSAGHVCGDSMDIVNGQHTGAIRASVGLYTTDRDIASLISCLKSSFITDGATYVRTAPTPGRIKSITVYPLKGAKGIEVESWAVCGMGLVLDRQWCLMKKNTKLPLSRKHIPAIGDLQPEFDFEKKCLRLIHTPSNSCQDISFFEKKDCGTDRKLYVRGRTCSVSQLSTDIVDEWLSRVLETPNVQLCARKDGDKSLSNTSAFLVVNEASVAALSSRVGMDLEASIFRGNILVSGRDEWEEDTWEEVSVGDVSLLDIAPCVRCTQINVTPTAPYQQHTQDEPLRTLMHIRRKGGQALFGVGASLQHPQHTANDAMHALATTTIQATPTTLQLPEYQQIRVGDPFSIST